MKPEQIEKRVTWLDEQRRKDAETIVFLKDRVTASDEATKMLEIQLRDLSSEVARLAALTPQIKQFNDALSKQRQDFFGQLKAFDEAHSKREKHLETMRKKDHEGIVASVDEVRDEVERIHVLEESIAARKQEEFRISRELAELEKRLDALEVSDEEQAKAFLSIDETKKLEAKRITELQSEANTHRIRLEAFQGEYNAIEDRLRRQEGQLSELQANENIRSEAQNIWMEKQELRVLAFEKEWKNWQKRFEDFEQQAKDIDERLIRYDENYRAMKQTRGELDQMLERLERRIKEVSEMQRISDNRMKQEWTNFQADDQKRWSTFKLTNDGQWRDHQRIHERMREQLDQLQEDLSEGLEAFNRFSEQNQSRIMDLLGVIKEWAAAIGAEAKRNN